MFLNRLIERNPQLIEAATRLHQAGALPPNSWIIDLDVIAENARILSEAARANHLSTYVMTKQYARNPLVTNVAMRCGLGAPVAVDVQCAKELHRYGIPIGHVGHLNQIPRAEIPAILKMKPEVFTVFSIQAARWISDTARKLGMTQQLMLRVVGPEDTFFEGQEGGFPESELETAAAEIGTLPNVRIAGTVSFPCIRYNPTKEIRVEPTPNFATIVRAAEKLRAMGFDITQINAPGNTSAWTMPMIAGAGGTHAEPGHGLLGTTPNHAFIDGMKERPAYLYLSEVSHYVGDQAYCFGGGFWQDIYDPNFTTRALVGHEPGTIKNRAMATIPRKQIIDYHGVIASRNGVEIGDTVLFGFRTQMHMTRAQVAVVSGAQTGKPELAGIFDHAGTMMDADRVPLPLEEARKTIDRVASRYRAG